MTECGVQTATRGLGSVPPQAFNNPRGPHSRHSFRVSVHPHSALRSSFRNDGSPLGLYLHIPFCGSICSYCNFNRGLFEADLKTRYVDALEHEIRRAGDGTAADTIFFGGGTPSLLDPVEVERLIQACRDSFALDAHAEITLETNPETVTSARMAAYLEAGVTRISLGVQSFNDEELLRLGRTHTSGKAVQAVHEIRTAGVRNVSLDLMLWLPGQSLTSWQATVDHLIALDLDHASLYLLELYRTRHFARRWPGPNGRRRPTTRRQTCTSGPWSDCDQAGFVQYEISNVSRGGAVSRHNLKYWQDGAWLGFGCGAHSTRGTVRTRKVSGTEDYIQRVHAGADVEAERHVRTPQQCLEEALFTGLRLTEGIDLERGLSLRRRRLGTVRATQLNRISTLAGPYGRANGSA